MAQTTALSQRRVLVTGASGFLGRHLCRVLQSSGAVVHGVSRRAAVADDPGVSWHRVDLTDETAARSLMRRIQPDVVFHLSGHGVGAPDLQNVLPTFKNDLTTTVNVLTVATEQGVSRIVLAASLEEPSGDADAPASPYAAAKLASTVYSRMFRKLYDAPIVTVRPFMTYGPGQMRHKLIPHVILSLLQGEPPKLSSGKRGVDWIYVDDVIDGMTAAAIVPAIEGKCYDLGSGELVTIEQVVRSIVRILHSEVAPQFGALPDRPAERIRVASVRETLARLGWQPHTKLEDGLKLTIEWYRNRIGQFVNELAPTNS